MKKNIFALILFILSLCLFGCVQQNNNVFESNSIQITKHRESIDSVDQTITVLDSEVVHNIVSNLNSLTLEETDYIEPSMVLYTLVFDVNAVNIISSNILSFNGDNTPYAIKKGVLDLDYLDALFTPLTEEEIMKQLIIDAYKKKYDTTDEVNVDKIYMHLSKNDRLVVPYLIDNFADAVLGSEKINGIHFYYRDSRRIEAYYNGQSYTLQEAVDNELLTFENLVAIAKIQNENCKLGHSWNDGQLIEVPGGGKEMLYTCFICGETKTESANC